MHTLDRLVANLASSAPATPFVRFRGAELTYGAADSLASRLAGGLRDRGVRAGQHIAILATNGPAYIVTLLAAARLGAVSVPINTRARGQLLLHQLTLTPAEVLVVDADLLPLLDPHAAALRQYQTVFVCGAKPVTSPFAPVVTAFDDELTAAADRVPVKSVAEEASPAVVMFTSGTTGRSKGCVLSHRYLVRQGELLIENLELRTDDVLYCPFPLYHLDALALTLLPAALLGTTAALGTRFSVSGFWDEIRHFGATVLDFMGATLTMLHNQAVLTTDRDNPARLAWGVPVPDFAPDFEKRFGLDIVELYGSTEIGVPVYRPLDQPRRPGSSGVVIPAYDLRLMTPAGMEVPAGEVGEIVVRPNEPHLIAEGYFGMPDETLVSRKNLWCHTGDLARQDADGWIYFVGRNTDTIRRRGENISAFEVEEVLRSHPEVEDVAAFGVASDLTEHEVMVSVVIRPGRTPDPQHLADYCAARMAEYMVPRYFDFLDALPRTVTEKVERFRLMDRGVTETTWDRTAP